MTTQDSCESVVKGYLDRLSSNFAVTPNSEGCYLVTPFGRPDGEMVEVEVKPSISGRIQLSDMGDTLAYLYVNGLTVNRGLVDTARQLSRRFGVSVERQELVIESVDHERTGEALHALIQAVLAVTDLIQKRRPASHLRFDEEVEALVIAQGAVYDSDYEVQGLRDKHKVRFHVDSNRKLLVQPLSVATENVAFSWAERWAYRFGDISQYDRLWNFTVVLDDRGDRKRCWTQHSTTPLEGLADLIPWSQNDRLIKTLTLQRG